MACVAHVLENHGGIVSIPDPRTRGSYHHSDGPVSHVVAPARNRSHQPGYPSTKRTSSSVITPSTMRNERKETGPSSFPDSAVETST